MKPKSEPPEAAKDSRKGEHVEEVSIENPTASAKNPGKDFEEWICRNWGCIAEVVNGIPDPPRLLFPGRVTHCGVGKSEVIDLGSATTPPKFTLVDKGSTTDYGTCDFTDATKCSPGNFFLEAKVALGSLILAAPSYRLLHAADSFKEKKSFWIVIAEKYNNDGYNKGQSFQPKELLIVGPVMLGSLLSPPKKDSASRCSPKLIPISPPEVCGVTKINLVK